MSWQIKISFHISFFPKSLGLQFGILNTSDCLFTLIFHNTEKKNLFIFCTCPLLRYGLLEVIQEDQVLFRVYGWVLIDRHRKQASFLGKNLPHILQSKNWRYKLHISTENYYLGYILNDYWTFPTEILNVLVTKIFWKFFKNIFSPPSFNFTEPRVFASRSKHKSSHDYCLLRKFCADRRLTSIGAFAQKKFFVTFFQNEIIFTQCGESYNTGKFHISSIFCFFLTFRCPSFRSLSVFLKWLRIQDLCPLLDRGSDRLHSVALISSLRKLVSIIMFRQVICCSIQNEDETKFSKRLKKASELNNKSIFMRHFTVPAEKSLISCRDYEFAVL